MMHNKLHWEFAILSNFSFDVQNSFYHFTNTTRLRVMLTITLSELMSDVQVTQMKYDGSLEESGEARRLRKSLCEMADEDRSLDLIEESGLPRNALEAVPGGTTDTRWSWHEVRHLSECLLQALDAGLEHALLVSSNIFIVILLESGKHICIRALLWGFLTIYLPAILEVLVPCMGLPNREASPD